MLLILRSPYFPILDVSFHLVHTLKSNVSYRKVIQVKQKKKKKRKRKRKLSVCVSLKMSLCWSEKHLKLTFIFEVNLYLI